MHEVSILGLVPGDAGVSVFLGNEEKAFSMHVDHAVGMSIALMLRGEYRERPLTHDLIGLIFAAFKIKVERIVINDFREDIYYARIVLKAENEVHSKIIEIDARPSDCLAIASREKRPVWVADKVWKQVNDVGEILKKLQEEEADAEGEDEE